MSAALCTFCTFATLIAVTVAVLFQRHPLMQPPRE